MHHSRVESAIAALVACEPDLEDALAAMRPAEGPIDSQYWETSHGLATENASAGRYLTADGKFALPNEVAVISGNDFTLEKLDAGSVGPAV